MTTKFSYGLHGIRRLGNQEHVLLRADDRSQSLAEDRMILNAKDTNRLGPNHYNCPVSGTLLVLCSFVPKTRIRYSVQSGWCSHAPRQTHRSLLLVCRAPTPKYVTCAISW